MNLMSQNSKVTSVRANHSDKASIFVDSPIAEGTYKQVYSGAYQGGPRKGEPCVAKLFKPGVKHEEAFFEHDIQTVNRAIQLVEKFNKAKVVDNKHILVNESEIWTFDGSGPFKGHKTLIEPFISDAQWIKFNSNTGWYPQTQCGEWALVMQALSHFTFHETVGSELLCDLQGGIFPFDIAVLTDPVIMSRSKKYGSETDYDNSPIESPHLSHLLSSQRGFDCSVCRPTDLGEKGIITFFARHYCNKYCNKDWVVPKVAGAYFSTREGTTMSSDDSHEFVTHSQ